MRSETGEVWDTSGTEHTLRDQEVSFEMKYLAKNVIHRRVVC